MKMICHSHANKTHFHKKGFAYGLILRGGVLELGSGLDYRAVPVIYEKAFKILHKVALGMVFIEKASFQDRQIGNTSKFSTMEIYDIRQHCDDTFE